MEIIAVALSSFISVALALIPGFYWLGKKITKIEDGIITGDLIMEVKLNKSINSEIEKIHTRHNDFLMRVAMIEKEIASERHKNANQDQQINLLYKKIKIEL